MDLQTKIIVIAGCVEIFVRIIPTKKNLSIIDKIHKIVNLIPNNRKNEKQAN